MGMFGLETRLRGVSVPVPPQGEVRCAVSPSKVPGDASSDVSGDGGTGGLEVPSMEYQRPLLGVIDGDAGNTGAIADAYALVAGGYEEALMVPGLPCEEIDALRACLRAARQISEQPQLFPAQESCAGSRRSLVAG